MAVQNRDNTKELDGAEPRDADSLCLKRRELAFNPQKVFIKSVDMSRKSCVTQTATGKSTAKAAQQCHAHEYHLTAFIRLRVGRQWYVSVYRGVAKPQQQQGTCCERAVRRVKEGTSAVLLQSGLNESWWVDSMECYTCLRNVTDLLSDGKTPYERRFGKPFGGPVIPFGSLVEYHPITAKDQSRIHQFGKKVLPGLFLGCALYAG